MADNNSFWSRLEPFDVILFATIVFSFIGIILGALVKESSLAETSKYILATMVGAYTGRRWSGRNGN